LLVFSRKMWFKIGKFVVVISPNTYA